MREIFRIDPNNDENKSTYFPTDRNQSNQKTIIRWRNDTILTVARNNSMSIELYDTNHYPVEYGNHPELLHRISLHEQDDDSLSYYLRILDIEWTDDGSILAILMQERQDTCIVKLYYADRTSNHLRSISSNSKQSTSFCCWSPPLVPGKSDSSSNTRIISDQFFVLAIGMSKGALAMYDTSTNQTTSILGKHFARITCGTWTYDDSRLLILGSEDCTVSISSTSGDTLQVINVMAVPMFIVKSCTELKACCSDYSHVKAIVKVGENNAIVVEQCGENFDQVELAPDTDQSSRSEKGDIIGCCCIEKVKVFVLSYRTGHLIAFAMDNYRVMWSGKVLREKCERLVLSSCGEILILSGDDGKLVCMSLKSQNDNIVIEILSEKVVSRTNSLLNVLAYPFSTNNHPDIPSFATIFDDDSIHGFCITRHQHQYKSSDSRMPTYASFRTLVAHITEEDDAIRIIDMKDGKQGSIIGQIDLHEAYTVVRISICLRYVAIVTGESNIKVYDLHSWDCVFEASVSDINSIVVSDHALLVVKGNCDIVLFSMLSGENVIVPEDLRCRNINQGSIVDNILVFSYKNKNILSFYYIKQNYDIKRFEIVSLLDSDLRHSCAISSFCVDLDRPSHVVVIDEKDKGYFYNAASSDFICIPNFPSNAKKIFWGRDLIHVFEETHRLVYDYVICPMTMRNGAAIVKADLIEHIDKNGSITQTSNNNGIYIVRDSAEPIVCIGDDLLCILNNSEVIAERPIIYCQQTNDNTDLEVKQFFHLLSHFRLDEVWNLSLILDKREYYLALANRAMQVLNVDIAINVYRKIGDVGMVTNLCKIKNFPIEDVNLISANIALLFMNNDLAEEKFLLADQPGLAIDMRVNLMQWEKALELAMKYDRTKFASISFHYAFDLEARDEYIEACSFYEKCLNESLDNDTLKKCQMGHARCMLNTGDINRGIILVKEVDSQTLYVSAGEILLKFEQVNEAAEMFLLGGLVDRATYIYIEAKNLAKVSQLSELNLSPKTLCNAAVFLENEFLFNEASLLYLRGCDYNSAVRLNLYELNCCKVAFDIARKCRSESCAKIVAKYCVEQHDVVSAIEFYLLAREISTSLELAFDCDRIDVFLSQVNKIEMNEVEAFDIAKACESCGRLEVAVEFFYISRNYEKALDLALKCDDRCLDIAIQVVTKAEDKSLSSKLIDYLLGEIDGKEREPIFLFRLFASLDRIDDAIKTINDITHEELKSGNYHKALKDLAEVISIVLNKEWKLPKRFSDMFINLHSYSLVKRLAKQGDHLQVAYLLRRILPSRDLFTKHQFQIVLSATIECDKVGLKQTAYECANIIMSDNTMLNQLKKSKFMKKVKHISSHMGKDDVETLVHCPLSDKMIPFMSLQSPNGFFLPMCIACGKTIINFQNACICPNTGFLVDYDCYTTFLRCGYEANETAVDFDNNNIKGLDPIYGKHVTLSSLKKLSIAEVHSYIDVYQNLFAI